MKWRSQNESVFNVMSITLTIPKPGNRWSINILVANKTIRAHSARRYCINFLKFSIALNSQPSRACREPLQWAQHYKTRLPPQVTETAHDYSEVQ